MKCVKLKGAKNLEIATIKKPVSQNGSVVVRVKACGICGSDLHYFEAGQPQELIMGHEFSGMVVDPGDREDLKIGDRVTGLPISPCGHCEACKTGNVQYCANTWTNAVGLSLTNSGGLAEFLSCRSDMVKKLPDKVTFLEGTMVEPSAVSLHAINLADIKVGDKVKQGQVIGIMGNTGYSFGVHCHYEVYINKKRVNPFNYTYYTDKHVVGNTTMKKYKPKKEESEVNSDMDETDNKVVLEVDNTVFEYICPKTGIYKIKLNENEKLIIKD